MMRGLLQRDYLLMVHFDSISMFFSGGGGGFVESDSLSLSLSVVVVVVVVGLKVDFLDLDLFVKVVHKQTRARARERALKRRIINIKCYFRNPISLPAEFSIAKNSPAMPPQIAAVTAVGFFRHKPRPPFGIVVFAPAQKPNG